jgi:lipopolysaccharide/colanic/teichoic acid biosynthesis glycosyltransferase
MRTDGGKNGDAKAETERITRIGRLIRAGSLDELPQIFNIIKGEMSFIGPRPLLEKYLPLYTAEQMRRHDVLPGISGWAQVNGRNELSWEQKFALDVWYVDHVSARLDMRIFLKTIVNLFRRKGIYAQENLIVGEYRGRVQHG